MPTSESSVAALTEAQIIDLPTTTTMPTGKASYAGKVTSDYNIDKSSGAIVDKYHDQLTGDFSMDADFDAKTVNTRLYNGVLTADWSYTNENSQLVSGTEYTAYYGELTGPGTISTGDGYTYFGATATGTLITARNGTTAADAHTVSGADLTYWDTSQNLGGIFKGADAVGIEGASTYSFDDGAVINKTLWANKQ